MICKACKKEIPVESSFCMYCGASQDEVTPSKPSKPVKKRGNGQGSVHQEKNGTWTAIATKMVNGVRHKRAKRGFVRKKDAIAYLPHLSFDKVETGVRKITFSELYNEWSGLHYKGLSKSKITAYRIAYKRCEQFYYRDWNNISLREMQEVVDQRPSYYTARDVKQLLSQMGEYAVKHEYFDKNRASLIELPVLEQGQKEAFSEDEIKRLWADYNAGNKFTGYALVMIYTGLRYGELKLIKKEDVYLDNDVPHIIGGIKSEAGKNRIIPIAPLIYPLIEEMCKAGKRKLLEMNEDNFRKAFDEMTARASVRQLKPHSCRHTFCTELARRGVPPAVIKTLAGHANYSTTVGYTHIQQLADGMEAVKRL